MSVKSQLHACIDSLMVGVRAAELAPMPDPRVQARLRVCLDVVERLEQSATDVSASQLVIALGVMNQAVGELRTGPAPAPAVLGAVQNAVDRLQRLHAEHSA